MKNRNGKSVKSGSKEPATRKKPKRGSVEALLSFKGRWHGPDGEIDAFLEELRRMKQLEMDSQTQGK